MAITVMLALAGAFFLSLTFVPAMLAVLIRGRVAEKEVKIIVWAKERYARGLPKAMARPWATIGIGVGVFALSAVAFQFIGSEFIPRLDERNLAIRSEERRVGKECVSTCRSRWSPYHEKKKKKI